VENGRVAPRGTELVKALSRAMKGDPPHRGGDGCGGGRSGERGSSSLLSGAAVLAGVAATGVRAAAGRAPARSGGGRGGVGGGGGGGSTGGGAASSEEMLAVKMDEFARVIGEVADKVLKHVSDRMPGLEAWTISTLDTIFAPRLVLRCERWRGVG